MELTLVIVITAVVAGFSARLLTSGVDMFDYLNTRKEALESSRMALQRMVKEVRQVSATSAIQKATTDTLRFVNINNSSVQLRYANQCILLNNQVLIDQISGFGFSFYNANGTLLSFPITNPALIWRIRLSFTRAGRSQPMTWREDIVPRNFRN